MNNKLLTVLGCSSSIALSILGADAVNAKEYVFTAPELDREISQIPQRETDYPFADCSCDEYDAETAAELDREGDKAISLYGCDCAGCRNLVRNNSSETQPQS
ncbi:hypothetical protein I4641_10080 [Waterburya agarophytonicola K14]|uniref:Uncharacterized protein n=1 Tax=Waterburya agarophytonicola KI4 TaxID=2874699 RepID=A0A964BQA2_9CYAN|nr:hypothetical protein [Waterburya agarophytonicola]MCC0177324.1 hypothetical protein [Waterburya agarophytonicola KI4]